SQARTAYNDARERSEDIGSLVAAHLQARAEVSIARLLVDLGDLKEAESHLTAAREAISRNELAKQLLPRVALTWGEWYLIQGDFAQAATHFTTARQQARTYQEPLLAAEALLGLGQTQLASQELDAASATFLEAGRAFQLQESTDGDGSAVLGMARVNISQQHWDEA